MRNFIISLICILIVTGIWGVFTVYSSNMTESLKVQSDKLISQSIANENWASAEADFDKLHSIWRKYRKTAAIFLDSKDINEIDCTLDKAHLYMEAHDVSNSTGEFSYLKGKFGFLHKNDTISFSNIF